MSTPVLNLTFHGIGEPPATVDVAERDVWLSEADFAASLRERGISATFFVVAGRLDEPGYLAAGDLRTLREEGMTIGLHGMHHQRWRGLSDDDLDEEISVARRRLEGAAGGPLDAAACPFGAYDRRVLFRLRRAGFAAVFTSDGGWASRGAWLQPRNTLRAGDGAAAVTTIAAADGLASRSKRKGKTLVKRWR
jgi:peptidoglycan/xylan/chitin deacetylase (PgdA/CDA1 family)